MSGTRAAVFVVLFAAGLTSSASASVVSGRVDVTDKGGKRSDRSNVVVWLESAGAPAATKKKAESKSFEMKSMDKKFQPTVIVIPVGSEVNFPNFDPIYHNVFSVSGDNRFDLGLYKSGASKNVKFEKPGLVRVYCNIHSQMVGFIHVLDSSWFATTGSDGAFELKGVPAGKYLLKTWEEKAGESSKEIVVTDAPLVISPEVDSRGFVPKPHLNKFGKAYAPKGSDDERY